MSTLAAEVQTPKKTFPRALALALIFTVLMYVVPSFHCNVFTPLTTL